MKVGLYTAIYGGYDRPKPVSDDIYAVMYTDDPNMVAPGWEVRVRNMEDIAPGDSMMQHKYWKTHPLEAMPDVDVSLWVDGSMEICVPNYVDRCLAALGSDDWACVPHPARGCIYPEASFSASLARYGPPVQKQAEFYASIGFPANRGLIATGANARRHTQIVEEISSQWWTECVNWTHQDQISLPVLFWLHPELKWNMNLPWHQDWILHGHG